MNKHDSSTKPTCVPDSGSSIFVHLALLARASSSHTTPCARWDSLCSTKSSMVCYFPCSSCLSSLITAICSENSGSMSSTAAARLFASQSPDDALTLLAFARRSAAKAADMLFLNHQMALSYFSRSLDSPRLKPRTFHFSITRWRSHTSRIRSTARGHSACLSITRYRS